MKHSMLSAAAALLLLASCGEKGQREPHPATLYDICEVAPQSGNPAVLLLYHADSDSPAVLTATGQTLGDNPPSAGTSILAAYIPHGGQPYVSDNITLRSWTTITNLMLMSYNADASIPFTEYLEGWDSDPVELLSAWRAGSKVCMRLKLPYSSDPRRFELILDPATAADPSPTAYLIHARPQDSPTFDRQYYVAFDISLIRTLPAATSLTIKMATVDSAVTTLRFCLGSL